jgi:hypothetical protein
VVAIKGKSLRTRNQDIPDEINTIRLWLGDR